MTMRQDHQSKVLYDLSNLIFNLMRYPPATDHDDRTGAQRSLPPISPAGFASMMLGMSLAMMICGTVTFFVGFFLMPWVIGLIMILYVAGVVSSLPMIGRAIFCQTMSPPSQSKDQDLPAWKSCE